MAGIRRLSAPLGVSLTVLLVATTLGIAGCGGAAKAQKRAYRADEAVSKERLRLVEEYDRCIAAAGGDFTSEAACERYLKSAEALK
jgi:hypothetical protein